MARPKKISMSVNGMTHYAGFSPLLNWWKHGGQHSVESSIHGTLTGAAIWDEGGYLDPDTIEIVNPAPADMLLVLRIFCTSDGRYEGEEFTCEWDGSANADFGGSLGVGGTSASVNSNKSTCVIGSGITNVYLRLTLTDHDDPPHNIRCYQSRYATAVADGKKFNPEWMTEQRNFESFRTMGWDQTNNTELQDFDQLCRFSDDTVGVEYNTTNAWGPKGGIAPSVIGDFVEEHGSVKNVHVCFPHKFTDAAVQAYAEAMRDEPRMADCIVSYEYSNECWNFQFGQAHYCGTQGALVWPDDLTAYKKWYGLRAAQVMKIVRDAYGSSGRSRWRGVLALHNAFYNVAHLNFAGVEYYLSDVLSPPDSLEVSDLFDEGSGTGYFGDVVLSQIIMDITKANPAVVNFDTVTHGRVNGELVRIYAPHMTEIHETYATVANKTDTTFELSGVDSTAYTDFSKITVAGKFVTSVTRGAVTTTMVSANHGLTTGTRTIVATAPGYTTMAGSHTVTAVDAHTLSISFDSSGFPAFDLGNNYVTNGPIFKWMEESTALNISNPGTYPTKYTLFNTLLTESIMNGTATSPGGQTYTTSTNIYSSGTGSLKTAWTFLQNFCASYGMDFGQYEGGSHFTVNGALASGGGNAQFAEFMFAHGHSAECATLYTESYKLFYRITGQRPNKFVESNGDGIYGTWGGVRYWKLVSNGNTDDTGNAVWQAVKSFNNTPVPETYTIGFV